MTYIGETCSVYEALNLSYSQMTTSIVAEVVEVSS